MKRGEVPAFLFKNMTLDEQKTIETFVLRQANAALIDAVLGDDIYDRLIARRLVARDHVYFLGLAEAEVCHLQSAKESADRLSAGTRKKIDRLLQNARGAVAILQRANDHTTTL